MSIKMYSTTWCGDCRVAKRFLSEMNIPYEEVNIEHVEGAAEIVMNHTGGRRVVPTFDINGKLYSNPRLSELRKIIHSEN
jgi:mycoredoxin